MSIVITGATGHLGNLVLEALLNRNVPAESIIAVGRSTEKLAGFAARGVQVKAMDYDDAASVAEALKGADKVLLISGSEVGKRLEQHRVVIEAAKAEGVELLAYTSIANAGTSQMKLAAEHLATEELLKESGLPVTILRNSWYIENYTAQIPTYLEYGVVTGSAGEGRVSAATRADYAEAAAAVLVADGQAGKTYELGSDQPFTLAELAAEVGAAAGKEISYQDLPTPEFAKLLEGAGVPAAFAEILADSDLGIARGDLLVDGNDLSTLLGRPTTTMDQAIRAAVESLQAA